eukprot:5813923-Pyramimonas_sp.AAC.1
MSPRACSSRATHAWPGRRPPPSRWPALRHISRPATWPHISGRHSATTGRNDASRSGTSFRHLRKRWTANGSRDSIVDSLCLTSSLHQLYITASYISPRPESLTSQCRP